MSCPSTADDSASRSRRRVVVAALLGALTFTVAACGDGAPDYTDDAPSDTGPLATAPSAAPEQHAEADVSVEPAVFTGPAVERYGQDGVQEAYRVASKQNENALDEKMMETSNPTAEDFSRFTENMTPSAKADFEAKVHKALTTNDEQAQHDVFAVSAYDLYAGESITERSDSPAVTNVTIGKASAAPTEDGRLNVTTTTTADLNVNYDGQAATIHHTKVTTFTLKKDESTGGTWLVDGYRAEMNNSAPVLVKAPA